MSDPSVCHLLPSLTHPRRMRLVPAGHGGRKQPRGQEAAGDLSSCPGQPSAYEGLGRGQVVCAWSSNSGEMRPLSDGTLGCDACVRARGRGLGRQLRRWARFGVVAMWWWGLVRSNPIKTKTQNDPTQGSGTVSGVVHVNALRRCVVRCSDQQFTRARFSGHMATLPRS
mgnify:CR=1 FL=1